MSRAAGRPLHRRDGFTLIELMVAIIIAGVLVGATTVAVSQALRSRANSEARQEAFSRAGVAAWSLGLDVVNLVRDPDLVGARVLLSDGGSGGAGSTARDQLLIFANSPRRARPTSDQAEGIEYEVQYRLQEVAEPSGRAGTATGTAGAPAGLVLWKRLDPVPDEALDGGGVALPVAGGIVSLSIEATDGEKWYSTWDSDVSGYPHALRIEVEAVSENGKARSTARRVVAIDRVPTPLAVAGQASTTGGQR